MNNAIAFAIQHVPTIRFESGKAFSWNADTNTITYPDSLDDERLFVHGLFHELSHAILAHASFKHDIDLLKKERDAWAHAKSLLVENGHSVDTDHIEDCLDTYRDWIYARSQCPKCKLVGLQSNRNHYTCPHCVITWKVPASRLCAVRRTVIS